MGAETGIEWCHHTFNPWRGCEKVSPGCANCYAERMSLRNPEVLGVWGAAGVRAMGSETYWAQPRRWDREAKAAGERRRVFCASLADVFEDRPELVDPRSRLMGLIVDTPNLDWLLLTKRPENVMRLIPGQHWPPNVWLGTSVEDQERADDRIPHLLRVPAAVRFLSVEPMLGPVDLRRWLHIAWQCSACHEYFAGGYQKECPRCHRHSYWTGSHIFNGTTGPFPSQAGSAINWVICGGESGPGARPMHPDWARSLRDQCVAAGVPFFMKQWGEFIHTHPSELHLSPAAEIDFQGIKIQRVGKKAAGRLLDGRTWDQFPEVAHG